MAKIKTVLIDLSGTLHIENKAVDGAVEALKSLRNSKVDVKFVTNTTKESRRFLFERLVNLGFELKKEEIFTSLNAANKLIKEKNLKPFFIIDEAAWEDFQEYKDIKETDYDSVIVGLAPKNFHYDILNKAFRLLIKGGDLIAIHEGRYYKQEDGLSLGPGAFVKGLEYASEKKATVVGKPTSEFFKSALNNADPNYAVMIGDDVRDDIDGAQKVGVRGLLVQTGKYRSGDENKISPPPHGVFLSFKEAVDYILQQNSEL